MTAAVRTAAAPVADSGPAVRIDALTKRFGTGPAARTALDEVSFAVRPGEVVALLGLSGSGKSTLLEHVNGLQAPTSGGGTVLGTDLATAGRAELRALRRRIGFVFQRFHLSGRLTVLENVCHGALGALRGPRLGLFSYPRAVREAALDRLERVGLTDWAFQRADTLSGGQQQRVALARALLQEPRLLLADEPVASLDPESAGQIMRLLREVAEQGRLTVLCSLHQVDLALSFADRIVGLRAGRMVLDVPVHGPRAVGREAVMRLYAGDGGADEGPRAAAAPALGSPVDLGAGAA